MHSPEVVVFDLHLPIPVLRSWPTGLTPRWSVTLRRYTGGKQEGALVYSRWRPAAWNVVAAGREVRLFDLGTAWHNEPDGADSGTVCKGMGGSELTWPNVRWAWKHRHHCSVDIHTVRRAQRWLSVRCAACGRRLRWREGGVGYMGDGRTWHRTCMSLKEALRRQDILLRWIEGDRSTNVVIAVEGMRRMRLRDVTGDE